MYVPDKYILGELKQETFNSQSINKRAYIISWPANNLGHIININFDEIFILFSEKLDRAYCSV